MAQGIVFEIQHFCTGDGPGIRSTVFLKGCPLRCLWCHNAEGLEKKVQIFYNSATCINCRKCEDVCPTHAHSFECDRHNLDFSACTACTACAKVCPNASLSIAGRYMTSEEVMDDVLRDKTFYETSNGGITISGGEPFFQGEFLLDIVKKAKENSLHVCIETSGQADSDTLKKVCEYTDLVLFDFKHYLSSEHKRLTGLGNEKILSNLSLLEKFKMPVILRCPIIPGCNDDKEHYKAIGNLAEKMENITQIHIEPYHSLGLRKYASLGIPLFYDNPDSMDKEYAEEVRDFISKITTKPVLIP